MPAALFSRATLLATFSLLAPGAVEAGKLLDYLRNYDLNDYAFGVALSSSQKPYPGSENSLLLYPYLTSFRYSAFTDDWLLIRGENLGLRFVVDEDWELGLVGRVQTLGQGFAGNDELADLDDRNWAVELGPLIGFRRWPLHMQFRSYWEAPNRHDGTTSELEFSLPRQYRRGFFVPAVRFSYLSDGYTDFYYGVSERESTAERPAYQPGSATNVWTGVTVGYELTPRWLLKSTVGIELLDTAIEDSPIVNRDRIWSGSVGFAYNADLFNPRDHAYMPDRDTFELRIGALSSAIDTKVTRRSSSGEPREEIDLEDAIGTADRRTVLQADARLRIGYYHRLQLGYFALNRRSTKTLEQDIEFGNQTYPAGTEIDIDIDSSLLRFAYSYSLMRDNQKELGVSAGLAYITFRTRLGEAGSEEAEPLRAEAPLPTLGVFASAAIGDKWRVSVDATAFGLQFDRYKGLMGYLSVGLERQLGDTVRAGLGYDFFSLGLEARDDDLGGKLGLRYHGPRVYLGLAF